MRYPDRRHSGYQPESYYKRSRPSLLSRRLFLAFSAGAILGVGSKIFLDKYAPVLQGQKTDAPTSTPTKITELEAETSSPATVAEVTEALNTTAFVAGEFGHTVKTVFRREGEWAPEFILVDEQRIDIDRAQALAAIHRAKELRGPQIVQMISIPRKVFGDPEPDLVKHPIPDEQPKDVLSKQELSSRNIELINADSLSLSIRGQAFEHGGYLTNLGNPSDGLVIALVDGNELDGSKILDPKYNSVRGLLAQKIGRVGQYRQQVIEEAQDAYSSAIQTYRGMLRYRSKLNDREFGNAQNDLLLAQIHLRDYLARPRGEWLEESITTITHPFGQFNENYDTKSQPRPVIFLAVGDKPRFTDRFFLWVDHAGGWYVDGFQERSGAITDLSFWRSCPNPEVYLFNPKASENQPDSYPYGAVSFTQALRHELAHYKLMHGRKNPDGSEYRADKIAWESIQSAWQLWERSGFNDNTGYNFIASHRFRPGYILI